MRNSLVLIFIALFLATCVLGCNAAKGAGKDLENAGVSIQKTVDKNN